MSNLFENSDIVHIFGHPQEVVVVWSDLIYENKRGYAVHRLTVAMNSSLGLSLEDLLWQENLVDLVLATTLLPIFAVDHADLTRMLP
jgi:hypothetical protein